MGTRIHKLTIILFSSVQARARTFTLAPQGNGTVEFTLREVFSGPLLPLIGRSLPDLTSSFEQFAAGLKRRAERAG